MADFLRRLNETGITKFSDYLRQGAAGPVPFHLLDHHDTSEAVSATVRLTQREFPNRYEFGRELSMKISALDIAAASSDRGLWTWLALYYFEQLSPMNSEGQRRLSKQYSYILSTDYRHYYRHLVRMAWQLFRDHGPNSRFLLLAADDGKDSLGRHGDILEQLGGTQTIIRNPAIIAEASRLYADPISGRPKRGVAGKGAGSIRRFARVIRQLDLTFAPEHLPPGGLSEVLPKEFNTWKKSLPRPMTPAVSRSAGLHNNGR